MCALCCQNVVCRTLSIKQNFEAKHENSFKNEAEKIESLKKAVFHYKNQSNLYKKVIRCTTRTIEGSYKVVEVVAKNEKLFTNGVFCKGGRS